MAQNSLTTGAASGGVSISGIADAAVCAPPGSQDAMIRQFAPRMEGAVAIIERAVTSIERQVLQRRNFDLTKVLRPISESQDRPFWSKRQ